MGWSGEFKDKETGENVLLPWDHVQGLLDEKIKFICVEVGATEAPVLFISDSAWLTKQLNKERVRNGENPQEFIPNFRYEVAKTKPYKGTRKNPKPYHFYNIIAHLRANYHTIISGNGLEADDEMSIYQFGRDDTIICSRDKDLRICPGHHYTWECGKQASLGPATTDRVGWLEKSEKGEVIGYGLCFFYYQMLVGDAADNIPGLAKMGKVGAWKLLEGVSTEEELLSIVKTTYKEKMETGSKDLFYENANLLWIIQERGKSYGFKE